jgi:mRNA interferase MazF
VKRGEIFSVVLAAELGKPRPALILQADLFCDLPSVTVVPLTSTLIDAPLIRLPLEVEAVEGLRKPSQLMIDKVSTVSRSRIGQRIGCVDEKTMARATRAVAFFLGVA